jgi:hypothetical protein
VLWRDFAHPSAGGILDSRLPSKRRADLQKTIIDRLFVLVKQNKFEVKANYASSKPSMLTAPAP